MDIGSDCGDSQDMLKDGQLVVVGDADSRGCRKSGHVVATVRDTYDVEMYQQVWDNKAWKYVDGIIVRNFPASQVQALYPTGRKDRRGNAIYTHEVPKS